MVGSAHPTEMIVGDARPANIRASTETTSDSVAGIDAPQGWWREWELWGLVALLTLAYFSRLGDLTIRGEEPRRARVAAEMIDSGDWVVPRQQGETYFSRPPLQNWAIATLGLLRNGVDVVAIRAPSVLAVLVVVVLLYAYTRTFLSRGASLAAAAAFATAAEVLKLGRLGETEALFAAWVSASLLLWHLGYRRGWHPLATWSVAYFFAALALLTKGFQGPVYFVGAVSLFLFLSGNLRYLFSRHHLAGLGVFLLVFGAWHVPYQSAVGWDGVLTIYTKNVEQRFNEDPIGRGQFLIHLVKYPVELFACLLPWSVLLTAFARRDFRASLGPAREPVLFMACALAVAFPTCWLVPTARTRYFFSMYPIIACLAGVTLDRTWQAGRDLRGRLLWSRFLLAGAIVSLISAGVVVGIGLSDTLSDHLGLSALAACLYGLTAAGLGAGLLAARRGDSAQHHAAGVFCAAAMMGLAYLSIATSVDVRRSEPSAPAAIAEIKRQIPQGAQLVSLGRIDPLFAYHYRDLIPIRSAFTEASAGSTFEYFCFQQPIGIPTGIPFPYETIAVINCERNRRENPARCVVVARRLTCPASLDREPSGPTPFEAMSPEVARR